MKVQSLNLKKGFLVAFAIILAINASAIITASAETNILLKTISFDPSKGEPDIPEDLKILEYPKDIKGYYIVQFTDSVKSTYKEELEQLGAEIYSYLPNNAFIVRMDLETKSKVEGLEFVQWVGLYQPFYKISPDISQEEVVTLTVLLFRAEDRDFVLKELESLNGKILSSANKVIRLQISKEKIKEIANLVEVEWIEEYIQPQLLNDVSRWVIQSYQSGNTPIWNHNITGAGQIVGISDTGLDYDNCFFWDSASGKPPEDKGLPSTVSPDYNQRKVIVYHDVAGYGDYDDSLGHGTHTSGSIAGDNSATIGGYDTNDGMAYNAKLVFQDIGKDNSQYVYLPADLNDLFQQAYNDGARIHSNSWGSISSAYTADSKESDEFMWNHKDFLILFANGNSGPRSNTVGSPATAKNVVSVGATENGALAENMAYFSSHGPTDDGRLKPTVGAPGVNIKSADSDGKITSYNCGYVSMSGTSMATPTTAGAAALIMQYFTDGYYPSGTANPKDSITPSAALIKAMLINSAREMTGSYTDGNIPSNGQGWGRILLDDGLYFSGDSRKLEIHDSDSVFTGQTKTYIITLGYSEEPLEVTLVWTDYPSTPSAKINLVNDLDLEVKGPSGTYLGNVFSGGESVIGGSADRRNVEEVVYLKKPKTGVYTITVTGHNVPYGPQPFALVITGGLGVSSAGAVILDKELYSCRCVVNVTLIDADLNQDNSTIEYTTVNITSLTELIPEIIKVKETGVDTAIFTGSISTSSGSPKIDGILQVFNGDLITVFYNDADDGTGTPVRVYDTATADCIAPIVTISEPINNTTYNTNTVALNYTVNKATEWVGYSLDGQNNVTLTGNTILTNLTNGWHNIVVYARDLAGNIGISNKVWFNITTPDIWVNPNSFEITLSRGGLTNRTLVIGNNGTGVLEFEISGGGSGGTGTGSVLVDMGHRNYKYTTFYKDLISLGYTVEGTKSKINSSLLSKYNAFITVQARKAYSADELTAIQNFVNSGGGLFVIGDDYPTIYEKLTGYAGINWSSTNGYSGYTTYIYKHPITENISKLYFSSPISSLIVNSPAQKVVLDSRGNTIQVAASEYGSGKVVALVDEDCLSDYNIKIADNRLFGRNIINWIVSAKWISTSPNNGTINPSSQTNITVTINTTGLNVSEYNATIVINNNDPDENQVKVPVHLRVVNATHDIAVTNIDSPNSVDINKKIIINSTVSNLGLSDESNIVVNFLVEGVRQSRTLIPYLASGASTNVSFTWTSPSTTGNHTLSIYANPVTGENITWNNLLNKSISVITIPDIWVNPTSYDLTLPKGSVAKQNLTIGNNGTGVLEFNVSDLTQVSLELFNDTFPSTVINTSNWVAIKGSPLINTLGINEPSQPYSLELDGSGDNITSKIIDLSLYTNVTLSGYYELGGGGESPDSGDWLRLYYRASNGSWINSRNKNGDGRNHKTFEFANISLPSDALHSKFQFRLTSRGSGVRYDDFYIDNVLVVSSERSADFLSETPTSGIVSPLSQTNITVIFDTTSLEVGEYNATIVINTNDQDEKKPVQVPVHLKVIS